MAGIMVHRLFTSTFAAMVFAFIASDLILGLVLGLYHPKVGVRVEQPWAQMLWSRWITSP